MNPIRSSVRSNVYVAVCDLVSEDVLRGCTEIEIEEVEAKAGSKLPLIYRKFLATTGRSAGKFLVGTDYLYPDVLTLRDQAERLLRQSSATVVLTKADFVFAVHQGYEFLFLRSGTQDPEVFLFMEGEDKFDKVAGRFSEWLIGCVSDEIAAAAE